MVRRSALCLALLLASVGLRAEFPQLGVQGAVELPFKDLKAYTDKHRGTDWGVHGIFDLGDGEMVRPRLDWTRHPEQGSGALTRKVSHLSLGVDYLIFTEGMPEGLYAFVGAGLGRWSFQGSDEALLQSDGTPLPHRATKGNLGLGLGYQWSSLLGTELRYVHAKPTSLFRADALQAGLTLRF